MKMVIETFVSLFFITLMVFVSVQLIGVGIQMSNMNEFHENVSRAIEDSGGNLEVVDYYEIKARELGYSLDVDYSVEERIRCSQCNSNYALEEDVVVCRNCSGVNLYVDSSNRRGIVALEYIVEIPLLNIVEEGRVEAYVR